MLAFDTSTPCARVAVLSPEGDRLAAAEKVAARHSSNLLSLCDEVMRATGVTVSDLAAIACGAGPGSFTGLRVGLAVAKGLALADRIPLVLVSSLDALASDLAEVFSWEPSKGSQTLRPPTSTPTPLASPFGDFGTCTFPTTPARYARALAFGLARWCAAGEGAREARGAGRVGCPSRRAGGLPTRLVEGLVLPCIDAGKGQVYGRLYRVADEAPTPIGTDELALPPEELCRLVQAQAAGAAVVAGGNGVDRYLEIFRAQLGAEAVRFQVAGPSALAVGRLALARLARGEHDDLESSVPRYGRPPDITKPKPAPTTSTR
jgi:tRNA threonylcarbamoyl adenosine modification protein YeaZ